MFRQIARLAPYAMRHRRNLIAIIAMTLMATAMTLLQPWPLKVLVDYALGGVALPSFVTNSLSTTGLELTPFVLVLAAGGLTLLIFVLNTCLDVGLRWAWMATGQRLVYDLACDTYQRLLHLTLPFHSRGSVGDQLTRLSGDTWCIFKVLSEVLVSPFQRVLTIVGIGVVAWMLDPFLTAVAFGIVPVVAVSVWYFGPRLKRRAKRGREAQSQIAGFVHQTVTAIPLVKAFNAESRNRDRFQQLADDAVSITQRGVLLNKSFALVNGTANSASRATIVFVGGLQVLQGNLSVGSLLVFLAYVRTLHTACTQLLQTYAELKTTEASLDRLFEIIDCDEVVREKDRPANLPQQAGQSGLRVSMDRVCFEYVPGRRVLDHVSLTIEPGERIAIVGPSGSGKTTLVSLLTRLHDVTGGSVRLNGRDVRDLRLDSLRSSVSLLLQDPYLLPMSIAENIAVGRPGASRDQVVAAARSAGADAFVSRLPDGYDTMVGQRGATLSGGQKQRLAIARAFIRNAPLLILDEPTSALDASTEAKLLAALRKLMAGRTTITIAHRLSSIRRADRIYVLEQGRILESGTHEELLRNGRLYDRFHNVQAVGALKEVGP